MDMKKKLFESISEKNQLVNRVALLIDKQAKLSEKFHIKNILEHAKALIENFFWRANYAFKHDIKKWYNITRFFANLLNLLQKTRRFLLTHLSFRAKNKFKLSQKILLNIE